MLEARLGAKLVDGAEEGKALGADDFASLGEDDGKVLGETDELGTSLGN